MTPKDLTPKLARAKWVTALRSGKYKQTKHHLADDNGFCCLGVACEVYTRYHPLEKAFALEFFSQSIVLYAGESMELPFIVMKWLGLRTPVGSYGGNLSLTVDNDRGKTFAEIANIIESEPEGLLNEA